MRLSLIAAVAANGVIGDRDALPWRLPADLKRFQRLTWGHWMLMGRKTFESIGRPLPGRTSLVVTRQPGWEREGVLVARSVEEALALAAGEEEVFVIGGAELYRQTLPRADRLHLTRIEADFPGDTRFPDWDPTAWTLVDQERHGPSEQFPQPYRFEVWDRRPPSPG